ncbi:MAG: serine/threonine-protein kinase [Polyangia bacterium]
MGERPSMIGPYRVVRLLGEGGMGAVYEAVHEAIERRVALKVLHPEFARNAEFTARFFNEARAVNRVEHPGLVQISDYGQQSDGTAYIVMEFLRGESLSRRLQRAGGRLSTAEVVNISRQIADALCAAHAKDIVHRDLKPDNVMLVPEPHMPGGERTKLLDFGIAKVADGGDRPMVLTKTDQFMGTPLYMSPEQCEGAGRVDAKSDVYSLGVMLFEMLSGQLPFVADGPGKVLGMHILTPPPLLKDVAPEVPLPLCDLVQRLLIKNRDERPSMREVVAELQALAEQYPLTRPTDTAQHAVESAVNPLHPTLLAPGSGPIRTSGPATGGPASKVSGRLPAAGPGPVQGAEPSPGRSTLGAAAAQAPVEPARPRRRWRRALSLLLLAAFLVFLGAAAAAAYLRPQSPVLQALLTRLRQVGQGLWPGADPALVGQPPAPTGVPNDGGSPGPAPPADLAAPTTPPLPPRPGPPLPPLRPADTASPALPPQVKPKAPVRPPPPPPAKGHPVKKGKAPVAKKGHKAAKPSAKHKPAHRKK